MTDSQRAVMQQALEALETYATHRQLPGPCPVRDAEYALRAALAEPVQEPVASVTECEACFTPDVCQLRGTCDHYAAERLRVAAPPQREPVHQWRKQMCADWYDGHPDHSDGGGPYETRTLYAAPPQRKPLANEAIMAMWHQPVLALSALEFARDIERTHKIE